MEMLRSFARDPRSIFFTATTLYNNKFQADAEVSKMLGYVHMLILPSNFLAMIGCNNTASYSHYQQHVVFLSTNQNV